MQKFRRTGWIAGVSLPSVIALFSVGAIGLSVTGCEEVEGAVTCAALDNFSPAINASLTGEAGTSAFATTRTLSGSSSIPSGVQVAGLRIDQNDLSFTGTGTGTVRLLLAVDSVVVGFATVNVANGQITSAPGEVRLGVFDNTTVTTMLSGLPAQTRAGLRLPSSSAEARTRTSAAVRSNGFNMTLAGQFTGDVNGTATLKNIGFFCD